MNISKYCSDYDGELEKSLDEMLAKISSEVAVSPIAPLVEFLVLGGGYGRGEGGILRDDGQKPRLYNDLDFFVFSKSSDKKERANVDKFFATMSRSWSAKLGIDVDFCASRPPSYAEKRLHMLMWHEMALGGMVIFGDKEKFAKMFPRNPDMEIPPNEIAKLLMNRFSGLLWASKKIEKKDCDFDFICRNINKSILACADAVLYSLGRYKFRTADKLAQIEVLGPADFPSVAKFKDIYRRAVGFKKNPSVVRNLAELEVRAGEARKLASAVLARFLASEGRRVEKSGIVGSIKNGRHNKKLSECFAQLGVRTGLFDNPVVTALKIVGGFLKKPENVSDDDMDKYLKIWKEIN